MRASIEAYAARMRARLTPTTSGSRVARCSPEINRMIAGVIVKHGITESELFGPRNFKEYVAARRDLAYDLRLRGWSFPRIGRLLKRHHTTVLNYFEIPPAASLTPSNRDFDPDVADESGIWAI